MRVDHLCVFLLYGAVHSTVQQSGFHYKGSCGYPGKPAHGWVGSGDEGSYEPGATLSYRCEEGYALFGEDTRQCTEDGVWSGVLPTCKLNIGLRQQTLQSATLWNYHPELAVDNNITTCSFTPRTPDTRWWQVHLGDPVNIDSVAVSLTPGSYQHFTIFIIELLEGNKALYKPCSTFEGQYETVRAVFLCNDGLGHNGQFVYIRDEREEQEYFGLCEVEVFPLQNSTECGDPEVPVGSVIDRKENIAVYSCLPGYILKGSTERECNDAGIWEGTPPVCTEVECTDPLSPKNGYIEVSNFRGRYQFGSVATYKCNPGFILWGNASRVCNDGGDWDGSAPVCHPITCGQPPQLENSVSELVNGTTTWNSWALYSCTKGFANSVQENSTLAVSVCTLDGTWSQPNINCFFDPVASANNFKKGRSLANWNLQPGGQINIGTLVAIGVLSSLIVLSLIIVIIIITHRRAQNQANSRKSSQSSSDHLISENCKKNGDFQGGPPGMVVYDDLNNPHRVDLEPGPVINNVKEDNLIDRYGGVQTDIYNQTHLTTFHKKVSPGRDKEGLRIHKQSPVSERSSGDGGSDKDGHYSSLSGRGEYQNIVEEELEDDPYSTVRTEMDTPYSTIRRPDGESEDDPYSSVSIRREELDEDNNYETLEREQNYEIIRKYRDPDRSVSSGTSSASQATVLLAGSDQDVQALYARVDLSKKLRNRNSDSSLSPCSEQGSLPDPKLSGQPADLSPTKLLINKFNNISEKQPSGFQTTPSSAAAVGPVQTCTSSPGAFTLGRPRSRVTIHANVDHTLPRIGSPNSSLPRIAAGSPNANLPKPLPRTINSFARTQGVLDDTGLKPSRVQQLVSETNRDSHLRSDETNLYTSYPENLPGNSFLNRNCDKNSWETANI